MLKGGIRSRLQMNVGGIVCKVLLSIGRAKSRSGRGRFAPHRSGDLSRREQQYAARMEVRPESRAEQWRSFTGKAEILLLSFSAGFPDGTLVVSWLLP